MGEGTNQKTCGDLCPKRQQESLQKMGEGRWEEVSIGNRKPGGGKEGLFISDAHIQEGARVKKNKKEKTRIP